MENFYLKSSEDKVLKARSLRREMTQAERKLWALLRHNQLNVHFRRQVPFGPYVLDFACLEPKLVIELDGSQHTVKENVVYDSGRDAYLREKGFEVFRFSDREMLINSEGVLQVIHEYVEGNKENT